MNMTDKDKLKALGKLKKIFNDYNIVINACGDFDGYVDITLDLGDDEFDCPDGGIDKHDINDFFNVVAKRKIIKE